MALSEDLLNVNPATPPPSGAVPLRPDMPFDWKKLLSIAAPAGIAALTGFKGPAATGALLHGYVQGQQQATENALAERRMRAEEQLRQQQVQAEQIRVATAQHQAEAQQAALQAAKLKRTSDEIDALVKLMPTMDSEQQQRVIGMYREIHNQQGEPGDQFAAILQSTIPDADEQRRTAAETNRTGFEALLKAHPKEAQDPTWLAQQRFASKDGKIALSGKDITDILYGGSVPIAPPIPPKEAALPRGKSVTETIGYGADGTKFTDTIEKILNPGEPSRKRVTEKKAPEKAPKEPTEGKFTYTSDAMGRQFQLDAKGRPTGMQLKNGQLIPVATPDAGNETPPARTGKQYKVGDTVSIKTPNGIKQVTVTKVNSDGSYDY